jgi:asparagine synthase (glutamine-hydrolysing)
MSAIVGIYHSGGQVVDRTVLHRMLGSLAHRGQDGAGMWSEGPVGFGQRMLWTTPESLQEKLPLVNHRGDLVITAEARIDNRAELLATLDFRDGSGQGICDSHVILAAYERWGQHCPEHLLGDFAFAIWDGRNRLLFCARDHFGVKPFYYHWSGNIFVFASELKALLGLPEVPQRLNEVMVADYLGMIFEDKTCTFYQSILRLPPAHHLTVCQESIRVQPYWSLDPKFDLRLGSDAEYAEAYREVFTEAVRCRLRSAYPVGAMLSGGLDSSSVTCVARDLLSPVGAGQLQTFSLIFDDVPESDEQHFIHGVLAQGMVNPHFVRGDRLRLMADFERLLWHQDEPFYGPNLFLNWGVWAVAQRQGVRVLLDGLMGDNVVSHGFAYLNELAYRWRWLTLARELKALGARRHRGPWRLLCRYICNDGLLAHAPKGLQQAVRALYGDEISGENPIDFINRDFAQRTGLEVRSRQLEDARRQRSRSAREDHYQGLMSGMIPYAMEVANRGAAAFSLEVRYPFLDRRVAEFCLSLPPQQKLRDGWTRMVARGGLAAHLPEIVRWRVDKGDLGPNFIRALVAEREILEQIIYSDPQYSREYLNVAILRDWYKKLVSHTALDDDNILAIFLAIVLESWLIRKKRCDEREHNDRNGGPGTCKGEVTPQKTALHTHPQ